MNKKILFLILGALVALSGVSKVVADHRSPHPANLDDFIDSPNFNYRVYYTNDDSTAADYFTTAQAQLVANALDTSDASSPANPGHHQLFTNIGFDAPFFRTDTPKETYVYDSSNLGGAYFTGIDIDAPAYLSAPEIDVREVTGHELFHHVQYGYIDDGSIGGCGGTWGKWTCEGTARAMQDKVYADMDADVGTTQASFLGEIADYLGSTGNLDTTLTGLSYKGVLFWTYAMEQLGTTATEPQRGVEAVEKYWDNASNNTASPDPFGVLKTTLSNLRPGLTMESFWPDHVIANYAKDLTTSGLADGAKYRYIDDDTTPFAAAATTIDQAFSPASPIGPQAGSVNSWAARYYVGRPDPSCQIIGFQSTGDKAGYGVLAVTGTNIVQKLHKSNTTDFAKAYINRAANPYTRIVAAVAGLDAAANYTYQFACGSARLQIVRPNTTYKAFVGEPADPDRFLVVVNVLGPDELGSPSVEGLDTSDFEVFVGSDTPADKGTILSGAYVQGSYWLVVQAPSKATDGTYPLVVKLADLASDTKEGVVEYSKLLRDQMLVIDASGSMGSPAGNTKLDAAKNAGTLFVDAAPDDDQLGVSWFSDNATTVHPLQGVAGNRTTAKNDINALTLQGSTSIGDGLKEGQAELTARGEPLAEDASS